MRSLKRLRNRVQHIGRAHEHHFRKIVFHVQVMVRKTSGLSFRVEHFPISAADGSPRKSVDILSTSSSTKIGFHRAGLLHHLDDLAGQGRRYRCGDGRESRLHRATPPSDTRTKLAASRMADGHGQRSLAPLRGGPTKAQKSSLSDSSRVGRTAKKLKDPFLDLIEAIVLFVQDFSPRL